MLRNLFTPSRRGLLGVSTALAGVALLAAPRQAHAIDLALKLEPGIAIPLTAPQSKIYDLGVSQSIKLLFGLTPWLDIGPETSFVILPADKGGDPTGGAWSLGGGLRLKRPHDAVSAMGLSPWLDADAMYTRTGPLNRPAFDVAAGLEVPVGATRTYWVGPFVRYMQIVQPAREGFDNSDAKILSIGLTLEVGRGYGRTVVNTAKPLPPETITVVKEIAMCADRDGDGLPDAQDRCPDVPGPIDNFGCPKYQRLTVKPDRLELNEKLFFAFDKADIEEESYPALDDVVKALKENVGFKVQVDGHTDNIGHESYNQKLSEARAQAVVAYLVSHGIDPSRLEAKGFASTQPIDTNETLDGREKNRRVEFNIFYQQNDGSQTP